MYKLVWDVVADFKPSHICRDLKAKICNFSIFDTRNTAFFTYTVLAQGHLDIPVIVGKLNALEEFRTHSFTTDTSSLSE